MKNMTLDQFKQTYEDWKLSGLSVRDYCNNTGFDEGKFYYWRRKLTDSALPDAQGFVPVRMNNLNGKLNITTASKEIESKSDSECEIIYANGVMLRINSANVFYFFGEKSQLLIDFDRNHRISSTFSETY